MYLSFQKYQVSYLDIYSKMKITFIILKRKMLGVFSVGFMAFFQSYIKHDLRKNKTVVTPIIGFFRH
jgi:hypothetical protein